MNFSRESLCHRHRLSHQQIDQLLGEQKSGNYLPEKLAQMAQLGHFLKLTARLQQEGIWFMVLKGPLLSQRIYADPSCRSYKDFDLLFRAGQVNRAIGLLEEAGFKAGYFQWPRSPWRQRLILSYTNQQPLFNAEKNLNIEVHWRLFKYRLLPLRVFGQLTKTELEETSLGGQSFLQFSPELELQWLILHGSVHAWRRLKWLVDIHELVNRFGLDEEKFIALTEKLKSQRMVALCNTLLQTYFPDSELLPCREEVRAFLTDFALGQIRDEKESEGKSTREAWRKIRYTLLLRPGLRYKLSVLRFAFFWLPATRSAKEMLFRAFRIFVKRPAL